MTLLQTEKQFQSSVRELAEVLGWRTYCTWDSRHSPKGWPDLILLRPPRMVAIELKSAKGKTSEAQNETLELLQACGAETHVFWPHQWDQIEHVLGGNYVLLPE